MSASDRASLINKLHKVCKKHFPEVKPPSGRTLLEHVVYACCLEDSTYESADEAFARLQSDYFDWNEVRVTTVAELAEVCKSLSKPDQAAARIKKALHGIFETYYSFDIDALRKENLGKTIVQFQKFRGVSPFVVSYLAQNGLGGHSIPVDRSLLNLFYVSGVISDTEAAKGKVPGLERTIPKSKGMEFASLAHQLAVAFNKSPFNKNARQLILSINATAKERFPKRGGRKKVEAATAKKSGKKSGETASVEKPAKGGTRKVAASKAPAAKPASKKKTTKKKTTKKPATRKGSAKPAAKKASKKTTAKSSKTASKKAPAKKKSPTKRLARKKPR